MSACTFIGHSNCPLEIKEELYKVLEKLIIENKVTTFYIGDNGSFDYFAYSVLSKLREKYEIKIIIALAYLDRKKNYYQDEETVFPEILETCPKRFAILKRNTYMIGKSEYLVAYVNNPFSNASKILEQARKKKINIINLGKYKC